MVSDRAAIAELAGFLGIQARYTDALGRVHEVSDESLLVLIGAFGLAPDPAVARLELSDRERDAPLGLSAVHLVHAEATQPELALYLPDGCREIFWTCRLESG